MRSPAKFVTIEEVSFDSAPAQKAGIVDLALGNTDLLKNAFAVLVAAALIFVFIRMLKRTKPDEIPIEILAPIRKAVAEAAPAVPEVSADMLNDMIRQKPVNVGAALRGWMTSPGKN